MVDRVKLLADVFTDDELNLIYDSLCGAYMREYFEDEKDMDKLYRIKELVKEFCFASFEKKRKREYEERVGGVRDEVRVDCDR